MERSLARDLGEAPENHFRRRARNHEVRRSRRKRNLVMTTLILALRISILGSMAYAAMALWDEMRTSPRYALDKIQLLGVRGASRVELLDRLSRFRGQNLFGLSLRQVESEARKHAWVWEASVRRKLPDTIEVRIRERVPFAWARAGKRIVLVDREGVVLGAPNALSLRMGSDTDHPVIGGVPDSSREEQQRGLDRAIDALIEIQSMAPEMLASISEVNVEQEGTLRFVLRMPNQTLWLTDDGIRAQLAKYFKLKDAIAARVPQYRHVDLRYRDRVIVRTDEES